MTKEELQQKLTFVNTDVMPNIEVYLLDEPIENEDGEIEFRVFKGRMHQDMPQQIIDTFYPEIRKSLLKRDYDLEDYNPSITPDRSVIWKFPTDQVPFYNQVIKEISNTENNYYDDQTLPYEKIWAIWIKLKVGRRSFYVLRKITKSKVLTTGGALSWVFKGETFRRLDKDVLTLDGDFDVFVCDGYLIFENKQNFEKTLLYDEIIQQVANKTLNEIKKINIIENFNVLKDLLADDYHSIRKLNKLSQKQYFAEKTFTDYLRIIQSYNVPIDADMATQKFKISDKAQAKLLIKVLNDDYLKSELTSIKYSANSKEET